MGASTRVQHRNPDHVRPSQGAYLTHTHMAYAVVTLMDSTRFSITLGRSLASSVHLLNDSRFYGGFSPWSAMIHQSQRI